MRAELEGEVARPQEREHLRLCAPAAVLAKAPPERLLVEAELERSTSEIPGGIHAADEVVAPAMIGAIGLEEPPVRSPQPFPGMELVVGLDADHVAGGVVAPLPEPLEGEARVVLRHLEEARCRRSGPVARRERAGAERDVRGNLVDAHVGHARIDPALDEEPSAQSEYLRREACARDRLRAPQHRLARGTEAGELEEECAAFGAQEVLAPFLLQVARRARVGSEDPVAPRASAQVLERCDGRPGQIRDPAGKLGHEHFFETRDVLRELLPEASRPLRCPRPGAIAVAGKEMNVPRRDAALEEPLSDGGNRPSREPRALVDDRVRTTPAELAPEPRRKLQPPLERVPDGAHRQCPLRVRQRRCQAGTDATDSDRTKPCGSAPRSGRVELWI